MYRALLLIYRALLLIYRALLLIYRALLLIYRALLLIYRAFWRIYRAFLWMYRALFWMCSHEASCRLGGNTQPLARIHTPENARVRAVAHSHPLLYTRMCFLSLPHRILRKTWYWRYHSLMFCVSHSHSMSTHILRVALTLCVLH